MAAGRSGISGIRGGLAVRAGCLIGLQSTIASLHIRLNPWTRRECIRGRPGESTPESVGPGKISTGRPGERRTQEVGVVPSVEGEYSRNSCIPGRAVSLGRKAG